MKGDYWFELAYNRWLSLWRGVTRGACDVPAMPVCYYSTAERELAKMKAGGER